MLTFLPNKSHKYSDNDKTQQTLLSLLFRVLNMHQQNGYHQDFELVFISCKLRKFKNKLNDNENKIYQ